MFFQIKYLKVRYRMEGLNQLLWEASPFYIVLAIASPRLYTQPPMGLVCGTAGRLLLAEK